MAHFDDFHGAVFTIQSIRMTETFHKKDIEIIVIDNSPDSPHGKALKNSCQSMEVRYIPFPNSIGTTQTRQAIFDHATGDAVLCMDCHVLLFNESLEKLFEFYEQNPTTKDLYTGPLYLDNLKEKSTHFDLLWRGQMWGVWGYAKKCLDCGYIFSYQPARDFDYLEKDLFLSMETDQKDLNHTCPDCGGDLRKSANNRFACDPQEKPFQIPSQGLGLFTCMKNSWLGFNPNFRHFGGEEGYIHYKYLKSGRKTICLPFLGWWHRFSRPDGVKYPLLFESKVKNYIHGFKEIGLPLEDIKKHLKITDEKWGSILNSLYTIDK